MNYKKYGDITGKILIIGFGSVGQSLPELFLRHFEITQRQITVLERGENAAVFKERYGNTKIGYVVAEIKKDNIDKILSKLLTAGDLIIDVSLNIDCETIIMWCLKHDVMYLNTSLERWATEPDEKIPQLKDRTLYAAHKSLRELTKHYAGDAATAAVTSGANPGLVTHLTKRALLLLAKKRKLEVLTPKTQRGWAKLSELLEVKVIQIAERDTQVVDKPRLPGEFANSWSPEGFLAEGRAPAELGYGSHENKEPFNGFTQGNTAYLAQPGCSTTVKGWVPKGGEYVGFLIQHSEAVTISEYLTLGNYRPSVYYAYCPTDCAIASMNEFRGDELDMDMKYRVIKDEIISGRDELGVLLLSEKGSMWYGSQLTIEEARKLIPGENATSLQVVANILGTLVWMLKNPRLGVVEPEAMDFEEILEVAMPYLGTVAAVHTDWLPTENRSTLYTLDPVIDQNNPLSLNNFLIRY